MSADNLTSNAPTPLRPLVGLYHHNLFAHHMRRMPTFRIVITSAAHYRNNVIYNLGDVSSYRGSNAHAIWVNNYDKAGPATRPNVWVD